MGTNKGLGVLAVIRGSPAFKADLFRDDVIMKIDDKDIYDESDFMKIINEKIGKKVVVTVIREGQTLTKEIELAINTW